MANVRVSLKLDEATLRRLLTAPGGPVYEAVRKAAGRTRDRARVNLTAAGRVDTGTLRNSIATDVRDGAEGVRARVGTDVKYASFIHEGTANAGAGYIEPRTARVLRFTSGGSTVFAHRVRGIAPTPYLTDALDRLSMSDFT